MKFSEKLNAYMKQMDCTAREICTLSGISASTFSRYRNGERVPDLASEAFETLCQSLSQLAREKGISSITMDTVRNSFLHCEDFITTDKENLRRNFNTLLASLNVNLTQLCQYTNYDSSAIFRIRNGTRNPGNPEQFACAVASFITEKMQSQIDLTAIAELIDSDREDLLDFSERRLRIQHWLLEHTVQKEENKSLTAFLEKLDTFDLNAYIQVIHFDELKVPVVPFQIPASRTYFGIQEMMESELDFLKATVLSRSNAPVTMYSDMPMKEMAEDPEFPKKWMYGMALLLKKGLHLNQIHNLDRSFDEMMLGLESWIPMYMTGQISPYYFRNTQNSVFLHFLKVSGVAALSGEAIQGYHADGKYYLTKSKREIEYYQKRAEEMLENASPLMDIYRSEKEKELHTFLITDLKKPGKRRSILSTLPLFTISNSLLEKILTRHNVDEQQKQRIETYLVLQRKKMHALLTTEILENEVPVFTSETFSTHPPVLELSGLFHENDLSYTEEEYAAHLKETMEFAENTAQYILKQNVTPPFRNLQIHIHENTWVMISKGKAPAIHFVIRHPKLRKAIENFVPPITDK